MEFEDWPNATQEHELTPVILVVIKVLVFVAVVLLSKPLSMRLTRDGKAVVVIGIVFWTIALAALLATFMTTDINDDEVFWLANSWGQAHGVDHGTLFLRDVLFRPLLWLGLGPSATVLAGRACVAVLAVICAWLASSMARRMGQSALAGALIGPLLLLWFAKMPMVFLRPEYFGFTFLMFGLWALLVPPPSWSRQTSIFLGFVLLALCSTTSLRQIPFPLGALACVVLYPGKISRGAAAKWAILGGLAGLAPTILWVVFTGSFRSVYYWNVVFPKQAEWLNPLVPLAAPSVLFGLALVGCFYLLLREENRASFRTLIILWVTATALAVFNPQKMGYALGPWLVLGALIVGASLSALPDRESVLGRTRWAIIVYSVLILPLLLSHATDYGSPRGILVQSELRKSQLRLIDWIDETRRGGPVICVSPYHPIRAENTWTMWNAWWYANIRVRSLILSLDPDMEARLRSREAAVIQWDPWRKRSEMDNVMQFWTHWGFVPPKRADEMARMFADRYVAVRWDDPLPERYGGGVFLVRKDLKPAPGVTELDARVILRWRRRAQ